MKKLAIPALFSALISPSCAADTMPPLDQPQQSSASQENRTAQVNVPTGFQTTHFQQKTFSVNCTLITPFTAKMEFRSKYEGSDKARDSLNQQALASYKASTELIYGYSRYLAKLSAQIRNKGLNPEIVDCYLENLATWANADAMLGSDAINGTGKAVRKWTLAAISVHYLRLQPALNKYATQTQITAINRWLSDLANAVILDYSNRPAKKINNHDYWAGWAVMVTSAVLSNNQHFEWAYQVYQHALSDIQDDGSLPNELRRKSRALEYHNFAIQPLVYMRAFIAENRARKPEQDAKLKKLATLIIRAIDDKSYFEKLSQAEQTNYKIGINGRLVWLIALPNELAPQQCRQKLIEKYQLQKQANTRLGGKACELFVQQCNGKTERKYSIQ